QRVCEPYRRIRARGPKAGAVESAARDRRPHLPLAGGYAIADHTPTNLEQRYVATRWVERVQPLGDFDRRPAAQGKRVRPERVQVALGAIAAAGHATVAPEIGVVRQVGVSVIEDCADAYIARVGIAPLRRRRDRSRRRVAIELVPETRQSPE